MAFNCQASHSPALPKRVSGWEQLSLENAWCEVMISEVQGADVIEFPFAESLPKSEDPAIMSEVREMQNAWDEHGGLCLLYTSPSPRDKRQSRMPSSA